MDPPFVPVRRQCRPPCKFLALTYNLANFMRARAMPKAMEPWSLTSLREKLISFQMAEIAVSR